MANPFYTQTQAPLTGASLSSSVIRNEYANVALGFDSVHDATQALQTDITAAIARIDANENLTTPAAVWVSGTTYAAGDVAYSPTSFLTYRRTTTGGGTTDPRYDTTNWREAVSSQGGIRAVASGAISRDGAPVCLNTDGTVSEITGVIGSRGTGVNLAGAYGGSRFAAFDTDRFVYIYCNTGTILNAKVGTVDGMSLSAGSAAVVAANAVIGTAGYMDVARVSNAKVVVAYRNSGVSNYGTAAVGTISGTGISFGTAAVFESAATDYISLTGIDNDKVVITYRDTTDAKGYAAVGTVSGAGISFGTPVLQSATALESVGSVVKASGSAVVAFYTNPTGLWAVVGTVSGTAISFGTPSLVATSAGVGYSNLIASTYLEDNKVVLAYSNNAAPNSGKACVCTVSGTSVLVGPAYTFFDRVTEYVDVTHFGDNRIGVAFSSTAYSTYGFFAYGVVDGTTILFEPSAIARSASAIYINVITARAGAVVIGYSATAHETFVMVPDTTNNDRTLGLARTFVGDGEEVVVTLPGQYDESQTGLTPGSTYYVLADGTLSTTESGISQRIGVAISATKLLVTDWSFS